MQTSVTPPPALNPADLDTEELTQALLAKMKEKMEKARLPQHEVDGSLEMVYSYCKQAADFLCQEPSFQSQEGDPYIVFEVEHCRTCMTLFMEGMGQACLKSWSYKIPPDVKAELLRQIAWTSFLDAKNTTSTIIAQDISPEIQMPLDQLTGILHQSAESALLYYMSEWEKENGPIPPYEPDKPANDLQRPQITMPAVDSQLNPPHEEASQEALALSTPVLLPEALPQPAYPQQAYNAGYEEHSVAQALVLPAASAPEPSPKDKWGALALFFSLLEKNAQTVWLERFSPDEQALITHYQSLDNIPKELNVAGVAHQLSVLQQQLFAEQKAPSYQQTRWRNQVLKQFKPLSPQQIAVLSDAERPLTRRYYTSLWEAATRQSAQWLKRVPNLSPALEEALAEFALMQTPAVNPNEVTYAD